MNNTANHLLVWLDHLRNTKKNETWTQWPKNILLIRHSEGKGQYSSGRM